jgi:hypothetical protein
MKCSASRPTRSEDGRTPVEPVLLNAEERTRLLGDDVLLAG